MVTGTVQEFGASKAGKPKIKISGNWYFCKTDKDTGQPAFDKPALNQAIEMVTGSFVTGENTFLTLESWKPVGATQSQRASQSIAQTGPSAKTEPAPAYIDEASLRFISNVVGQAIAAKTISTPGQMLAWFTAAKLALEGKQSPTPFSDNLPGREPGSDDDYGTPSGWDKA